MIAHHSQERLAVMRARMHGYMRAQAHFGFRSVRSADVLRERAVSNPLEPTTEN